MTEASRGLVVQIAPSDKPPFGDICAGYRAALESLGLTVLSIVLSTPRGEPLVDVDYLQVQDLSRVGTLGRALRQRLQGVSPLVAICHRYRAYRVLRASGVKVPRVVAIAHEFGFFKRRQRRVERAVFARSVLFAGVSPAVQAELAATVDDPLWLPNALDFDRLAAACLPRSEALEVLGVPETPALTIGLVGRLVEKKDPQLALEALRCLLAETENVRLLVIGTGPLLENLRESAAGLPVVFCGVVANARRLFSALDVLLMTSSDAEAFGMVALEAMASRLPVVAGPSPGPQSVLGSAGYYYTQRQPEEVAATLLRVAKERQDGRLEERMEHGYQRALREFSIAALARRLDDLFFRTG